MCANRGDAAEDLAAGATPVLAPNREGKPGAVFIDIGRAELGEAFVCGILRGGAASSNGGGGAGVGLCGVGVGDRSRGSVASVGIHRPAPASEKEWLVGQE